jgi:uncharacterized membrane protein YqhA
MSKLIEKTRYLVIIAVIGLLLTALVAFVWGVLNMVDVFILVFQGGVKDAAVTVAFLKVVDGFLIATTLLIFSISLYELFIAELKVPKWMLAHNLHDLKARLSSMVVLVMAVKFVEKLAETGDARSLLLTGIAVTVVSAALIAFSHLGAKD